MRALIIESLPRGGFVVREAWKRMGEYSEQLFASTSIDEALDFIKQQIGGPQQEQNDAVDSTGRTGFDKESEIR